MASAEPTARPPLSVLDISPIASGSSAAAALRATIDLAVRAEELGYRRFWIAEHHFAKVAGSSPATQVALVAAATRRIRVGAAAVQIGLHQPAAIVEAFGMVDALYPGRLDLGVGRSPQRLSEAVRAAGRGGPSSPPPAMATQDRVIDGLLIPAPPRPVAAAAAHHIAIQRALIPEGAQLPDFGDAVDEVRSLIGGTFGVDGRELTVSPGQGADVELWVLGSSAGQSAQVAGERGLPFVAAYHIAPATTLAAVEAYRNAFRPSEQYSRPYVVVSADAVVADDDATARELASGFGRWVYGIRSTGAAPFYPAPGEAAPLTDDELPVVADRIATQFVGAPQTVVAGLEALARATGADEIVVTTATHDPADRVRSYELLATAWPV
ncbi:LLM class flavin-dependent oxidoreductase [Williamsia sp. CHRR-6]|uniref:LLM class flavin-dependent oxidoreductase n=1 Tax=Williamsia sp. CHRR-6 TaxID=2835871 RepID=UPI001BD97EAA|nr:LLM class flavin-dependent oxidoreductase [Williamsia sp. CHRR-6]MBT0566898.1 LLM class flavin-dependent oxidoreductase [Williamsia sp. CHRR-6]